MSTLSIIIPAYNAAATIGRTITSLNRIASPTRFRVQVIVVNDGSTDATAQIVDETQQSLRGFNWVNINQANSGLSAARNSALTAADGDWVWFLDADDELRLNVAAELPADPEITGIGFALEYYRHSRLLRRIRPRFIEPRTHLDVLSAMNPFQPSALVFRRSTISHPFDLTVQVVNDWLFWLQNRDVFNVMQTRADRCIARIHIHGANMSRGYALAGYHRTKVARRILSSAEFELSSMQHNNFFLQEQIGLMQQSRPYSLRTFATWPCDTSLYAKALTYAIAGRLKLRATAY